MTTNLQHTAPHFNPQHLGPLQQWTRTTMTGRTEEVNLFPSQPRTKSILSGHHIPPTWYPKRLPCDFEDFGIPNNISSNLVGNYENHPWATSLASPISQSLMTMFNKCLVKHIFFHGNDLESTLTETALLIRGCFEYQVHINVVKRWFLYVLVSNKHSRTVHHFGWYERNKWECFIAVYQNVSFGGCSLSISFLSLARLRWTGGFCINLKMYKHDIQILHAYQIMNYLVSSTPWRKKIWQPLSFWFWEFLSYMNAWQKNNNIFY